MPVCSRCSRDFQNNGALAAHRSRSQVCQRAEEIRHRYLDGESHRMIAKELDIDAKSIYRYLRSMDLTRNKSQANEMAWDTGRFEGPDPDLTIDDQFSWLVGVLLGDGSVFKATSKEYVIALEVIDSEFIHRFEKVLANIGLSPSRYATDYKKSVRACSKKFYTWWNRQTSENLIQIADVHPAPFVRGIYDSEGGVYYSEPNNSFRLDISITERWILETIKRLTKDSIGHDFYGPNYYYGTNSVGKINLYKRNQLKDFFDWIDPTITRKGIAYMDEHDPGLQR